MQAKETNLKGCFVLSPDIKSDERGYFFESFNKQSFERRTGAKIDFVQDNQSMSSKGVLRGLHYQTGEHAQAKLVRVIKGKVLDACVDLRVNSVTFGQNFTIVLDDIKHEQLFIPRGFAHGFLVLEDQTIFNYKCDNYYNKMSESGIIYNDPTLGIDWNFNTYDLLLSDKDRQLPTFEELFK